MVAENDSQPCLVESVMVQFVPWNMDSWKILDFQVNWAVFLDAMETNFHSNGMWDNSLVDWIPYSS